MVLTLLFCIICDLAWSDNTIYVGFSDLKSFDDAQSYCQGVTSIAVSNGQLATWDSTDELTAVVLAGANINNIHQSQGLVGLKDTDGADNWEFIDGEDCPDEYCLDYITSGPNIGEECAILHPEGPWLNDGGCGSGDSRGFICEFDTPSTISSNILSPPSEHNVYILEFTSSKDIILALSVFLNIMFICYSIIKFITKTPSFSYSKVNNVYSTDEDEKL